MTLITGGSKCGKSALAESLLEGAPQKLYIATMIPHGDEAYAAIARHRKIRAGKGFETLELYTDLQTADVTGRSVLLECLGNLTANELFREESAGTRSGPGKGDRVDIGAGTGCQTAGLQAAAYITEGLRILRAQTENLVIVTNQVGADGITYDPGTMDYIRVLGEVNRAAAQMADRVIECVYGIPVMLKDNGK